MKTYILFWLDGEKTEIEGSSIEEALNNSGFGKGALRALDFYSDKEKETNYYWNKIERRWINKEIEKMFRDRIKKNKAGKM